VNAGFGGEDLAAFIKVLSGGGVKVAPLTGAQAT